MTKEIPVSRYVLGYILWAISIVAAAAIGLIARDVFSNGLVLSAASQAGVDKTTDFYRSLQLSAVEPWTYVFYGIVMVTIVGLLEHFFREGVSRGRLLPRFLLITGIEVGVLALTHATRFAMSLAMGGASWIVLVIAAVELVMMGVLFWLFRRISSRKTALA